VVFLIGFKTNHVQNHKSTPLLSIFSFKLQWTKGSLKQGLKSPVFYILNYCTLLPIMYVPAGFSISNCEAEESQEKPVLPILLVNHDVYYDIMINYTVCLSVYCAKWNVGLVLFTIDWMKIDMITFFAMTASS